MGTMVGIGMDYMIGLFKIFQNDVGPHWHMPNNCDMVMDHATCEHRLEGWMNIQLIISYDRGLSWVLNSFISFVKFGRRIQLPSGNQTWQREIFHLLYVYIYIFPIKTSVWRVFTSLRDGNRPHRIVGLTQQGHRV